MVATFIHKDLTSKLPSITRKPSHVLLWKL